LKEALGKSIGDTALPKEESIYPNYVTIQVRKKINHYKLITIKGHTCSSTTIYAQQHSG
jgi:hypothetical protein